MRHWIVVLFISLLSLSSTLLCTTSSSAKEIGPEEQLWHHARSGDVAQVKSLLEKGVPVDAKTEFDCTALYFAANSNQTEVMEVLIAAGAEVDVRDNSYGFSALAMAAWLGHAPAVEILLKNGADPEDAVGGLFAAASNGWVDVVEVMLKHLKLEASQLDAVLAAAQRSDQAEVAALLQAAGATAAEASEQDQTHGTAQETQPTDAETSAQAPSLDPVMAVAKAEPWPEFRGPGRSGTADGQHPPLAWDLESGRNVRWQRPVEGLGLSSPIIWGDRIFVTTAVSPETEQTVDAGGLGSIALKEETSPHQWQLHAYDLHSGELAWKRTAHRGAPKSQRHWKASQANPTAVTNGKVLVAFFGSEGLFAYDLSGKLLWKQDLGILNAGWYMDPAFQWGFAGSPIIDGNRVIVQADIHGSSFVMALDLNTGKELWRTDRDELPSWGTPLVYRDGKHSELVLSASKAIIAYAPDTGKELWRIHGNSPITVASPIAQDGLIIVTGGYRTPRPIYAVKPGGRGDITPPENGSNPNVTWSNQKDGAYNVTPLLYRGILYLLRDNGVLTTFDAATGEQIYRERVRGQFTASPVAADGRIYVTDEDGDVRTLQAGRTFKLLAESSLDSATLATPAISDGLLVFRTVKSLIGVGFPKKVGSGQAEKAASP